MKSGNSRRESKHLSEDFEVKESKHMSEDLGVKESKPMNEDFYIIESENSSEDFEAKQSKHLEEKPTETRKIEYSSERKVSRKSKKTSRTYTIVMACFLIIILAVLAYYMIDTDELFNKLGFNKVAEIQKVNDKGEITEEYAKQLACEKFGELRETVKPQDVNILKIERDGEEYYYINSSQNSVEIKLNTCKITRVNSEPVN